MADTTDTTIDTTGASVDNDLDPNPSPTAQEITTEELPDAEYVRIRSFLAGNVQTMLDNISVRKEASKIDSEDLFGAEPIDESVHWATDYPTIKPLDLLMQERDSLGIYVSGHPLANFISSLDYCREVLESQELHIVLIEKSRRIFTKAGAMMFALDITMAAETEKHEGIIFPKSAQRISTAVEDKNIFWVKGKVMKKKKKKKEDEDQYEDLPKLAVDDMIKFEHGPLPLYEYGEIGIPINRKQMIQDIDWQQVLLNPSSFDPDGTKESNEPESQITEIKLPPGLTPEKIKEIKELLEEKPSIELKPIKLMIKKDGEWKKTKNILWGKVDKIQEVLKS